MAGSNVKQSIRQRFLEPIKAGQERRIVFWSDENQQFEEMFDELEIENVKKHKLTGRNFLKTKMLIEKEDPTSDYLIYCPLKFEDPKNNWLMDVVLYSEEFKADFASLLMEDLGLPNRLDFQRSVKKFEKFFRSNTRITKLSSYNLQYKETLDLELGIFAVLANAKHVDLVDILYALLEEGLDKETNEVYVQFEKFGDIETFNQLVQSKFGFSGFKDKLLLHFWTAMACTAGYHKVNDLLKLADVKDFVNASYSHGCYDMMNRLIHDQVRDKEVRDVLVQVEDFLKLPNRLSELGMDQLVNLEVFPAVNSVIFNEFVKGLISGKHKPHDINEVILRRREMKWYNRNATFYDSLYYASKMVQYTMDHSSGIDVYDLGKLWEHYQHDYYLMDQLYRKFVYVSTKAMNEGNVMFDDGVKDLSVHIENVYKNWFLDKLGERWSSALETSEFKINPKNMKLQTDFYNHYVSSFVGDNIRTFVIISDGLRYEIAKELNDVINRDIKGSSTISAMSTLAPSITKVGMAALLPNHGITYQNDVVTIDGIKPDSLDNRVKILKRRVPDSDAIQANRFMEMKRQERSDFVKGKKLIYIYHDQIDSIGDKAVTESQVFEACNKAIDDLKSMVRVLVNEFEAKNVFITADHGFIYTHKPLMQYDKVSIDKQIEDIGVVNRRFIITEDTVSDYTMHKVPLNHLGSTGYLLSPKQYMRFKVAGGGSNYVHGGLSLQEMMIPVISYKSSRFDTAKKDFEKVRVELLSESRKITNLTFALNFLQAEALRDKMIPSKVYVQFEDIHGRQISDRQIIIADRTSLNANDRTFRKQFTLRNQKYDAKATYYLVIGEQNDQDNPVYKKIEFEISVLFSDDFGF